MHYLLLAPTDLGHRRLAAGVHEVDPAEADSILVRGTGRPATVAEIAAAAGAAPAPLRECAEARPEVETAVGSIMIVRRRRAAAETAAA